MLDKVDTSLRRALVCITNATSQLRAAYQQDVMSLTHETVQYRSFVYSECHLYGQNVLPSTFQLFENVKDVIEYYVHLDYEVFRDSILEIHDECRKYCKYATIAQAGYVYVLTNFKALENQMQSKASSLTSCSIDSCTKAENKRAVGATATGLGVLGVAVGAALVPLDGGVTLTLSVAGAVSTFYGGTQTSAVAQDQAAAQLYAQNAAIFRQLVESLQNFIEAVEIVARFLSLLETELSGLAEIGVDQEFKKLHYHKIRGKARGLVERCACFIEIKPVIQSDLQSMREQLDKRYAAQWKTGFNNLNLEMET